MLVNAIITKNIRFTAYCYKGIVANKITLWKKCILTSME